MAFDEKLSSRIAELLTNQKIDFIEKKMFGGIAFMISEKMCVGVVKDSLMLRVLDDVYDKVLGLAHAKPMQFTGRTMKGFVFVEPDGFPLDTDLMKWIDFGIEFGKVGIVKSKAGKTKSK